jgi:hypothetical protein
MILVIDVGNTQLKGCFEDDTIHKVLLILIEIEIKKILKILKIEDLVVSSLEMSKTVLIKRIVKCSFVNIIFHFRLTIYMQHQN